MVAPFSDFTYNRPDISVLTRRFDQELSAFVAAESAIAQQTVLLRLAALRDEFSTMYNLCYIRHTADTNDRFYEEENEYFDQNLPTYEALNSKLYRAITHSPFRAELEQLNGHQMFVLGELAIKTFHPDMVEDMKKENALSSEYTRLKAQASLQLDGKTYNLSSIHPLELSDDRALRSRSSRTKWAFYADKSAETERIFDDMVKLRHKMAQTLGYKNFVELGYARMRRSDYQPELVANFRKQVRDLIVPIASALYERQRQRLGLEQMFWYDEDYRFANGNPKPIGTPEEIIANANRMYRELSPETHQFFQYMQDGRLMDLVNRNGKAPGGYCTYMAKFNAPFIFSNFNGTSGDIDVLTHEAGHAFQVWCSGQRFPFEEYQWPTSDAAEIHSMSMEFFTWPWMQLFFGDQTDKYHFMHLAGSIQFLPYGVAVDEFQHIIYENPDLTPSERNAEWRKLEQIYLPHRQYDGLEFLEKGGFWQKQSHIFNHPFYYIDYTLAQICAFQFWKRDREDHQTAWADYVQLCKAGGSQSFLNLVQLAGLRSPFDDGCVASVVREISDFLNSIDDSKF
jgi:M3 family oligoendopeptidase